MITAGIDIGSVTTKAVLVDQEKQLLSYAVLPTGGNNKKTAEMVFDQACSSAAVGSDDVSIIISTGYGRENIPFADKHITEITCHGKGMHALLQGPRTVIDIGGQDTKGIQINEEGRVLNFVMNDKCAAGTGRFLDVLANALGVQSSDLGELSEESEAAIKISSMCTVFAESEVVSLVANGAPVPDIIKGIHDAIAERSVVLLRRLNITGGLIAMSGGVAKNKGMVKALEERIGSEIEIPDYPQIVGAFGAAIIGQEMNENGQGAVISIVSQI